VTAVVSMDMVVVPSTSVASPIVADPVAECVASGVSIPVMFNLATVADPEATRFPCSSIVTVLSPTPLMIKDPNALGDAVFSRDNVRLSVVGCMVDTPSVPPTVKLPDIATVPSVLITSVPARISTLANFKLFKYNVSDIVSIPIVLIRIVASTRSDPMMDVSPKMVLPNTERLLWIVASSAMILRPVRSMVGKLQVLAVSDSDERSAVVDASSVGVISIGGLTRSVDGVATTLVILVIYVMVGLADSVADHTPSGVTMRSA